MKHRIINLKVSLRPFKKILRKMGFTEESVSRSTINDQVHIWVKEYPKNECKLDLQLWGDGHHRVSHWHPCLTVPEEHRGQYGQMNTYPTNFNTVEEMIKAIEHESTRWIKRRKDEHDIRSQTVPQELH